MGEGELLILYVTKLSSIRISLLHSCLLIYKLTKICSMLISIAVSSTAGVLQMYYIHYG